MERHLDVLGLDHSEDNFTPRLQLSQWMVPIRGMVEWTPAGSWAYVVVDPVDCDLLEVYDGLSLLLLSILCLSLKCLKCLLLHSDT